MLSVVEIQLWDSQVIKKKKNIREFVANKNHIKYIKNNEPSTSTFAFYRI